MKVKEAEQTSELSAEWRAVLAYYENDPLWSSVLEYITKPMKDRNETERLAPTITEGLYGKTFVSSVSRIESYYSCPFQHFASYGLGLQERMEFTLEAPSIGDLFHAALKWVSDEMNRTGRSWTELTKEQCWQLSRDAMEHIAPMFFNRILTFDEPLSLYPPETDAYCDTHDFCAWQTGDEKRVPSDCNRSGVRTGRAAATS